MSKIYYIGGSPCSGKSTVAEYLANHYNLYYFKVDDYLEKYTHIGAEKGYPICKKEINMTAEELWMRDPMEQCAEEFEIYEEIFDFVMQDLKEITDERDIIAEGAALLPYMIKKSGIPTTDYLSIIPSAKFQVSHYKQREWVPFVLDGCSDKAKAFDNWMQRDILFAQRVHAECIANGYLSIINDGQFCDEELIQKVTAFFFLNKRGLNSLFLLPLEILFTRSNFEILFDNS